MISQKIASIKISQELLDLETCGLIDFEITNICGENGLNFYFNDTCYNSKDIKVKNKIQSILNKSKTLLHKNFRVIIYPKCKNCIIYTQTSSRLGKQKFYKLWCATHNALFCRVLYFTTEKYTRYFNSKEFLQNFMELYRYCMKSSSTPQTAREFEEKLSRIVIE